MRPWSRSRTPTRAPPRTSPSASASIWRSSSSRRRSRSRRRNDRQILTTPTASPPIRRRTCVAALVFGPDAGLVRERAETLMKTRGRRSDRSLPCRRSRRATICPPIPRGCPTKPPRSPCWADAAWCGCAAPATISPNCSIVSGRPARAMRWWWSKAAISPRAPACARCSRTPTTPPPSPAIPTPRAICPMWCATRCAPKGFPSRPTRWPMRCRGWARTAA